MQHLEKGLNPKSRQEDFQTLSPGTSPPLMDALTVYGSSSSSSESDDDAPPFKKPAPSHTIRLPPPCMETLNSIPNAPTITIGHERRTRSFPHVEGNFALHVYIPVIISHNIKCVLETLLANAFALCPQLCGVDIVQPVPSLDNAKRIIVAKEYHISLSHTVPVRIHQISSLVSMMRQRFCGQKRFTIEFGKWEIFVNEEKTRSFLALEILSTGLLEISRQVNFVNEAFKLHNLPSFYENPRPHISLAWAVGDIRDELQKVADVLNKSSAVFWSYILSEVNCKAGQQDYWIWKSKQ